MRAFLQGGNHDKVNAIAAYSGALLRPWAFQLSDLCGPATGGRIGNTSPCKDLQDWSSYQTRSHHKERLDRDFVVPKVSPRTEGMAEAYTGVEVIDLSGQKLLRIDGQTLVKSGRSYTLPKRWLTRTGAIVEPNGTLRDFLVLTSLFDLSKPGVYNISARAEIPAPDSGPQIKWIEAVSNRASFAVTQ